MRSCCNKSSDIESPFTLRESKEREDRQARNLCLLLLLLLLCLRLLLLRHFYFRHAVTSPRRQRFYHDIRQRDP